MPRYRVCVLIAILVLPLLAAGAEQKKSSRADSAEVFGLTKLWTLRMDMTLDAWTMMQPKRMPRLAAIFGFGNGATTRPSATKQAVEGEAADVSPFGYQYAYVKSTLQFDKETYRDVGIRFKGNSSYNYGARGYKRPFKVDFNRFVDKQEFHGLPQLNLSNNAYDPHYIREAISYQIYREAGVPAPRTAFAIVYLTIDGICDNQCVGLYTIIEEPTKGFLKEHFGTSKGLLLKPEGFRALPYLGDDWKAYESKLEPKTESTPYTQRRLIEFFKLIHQADDATFRRDIGKYLAVDNFLRYMAATVLLANLDSFLVTGHNFFMYVNPDDGKVYFMPWDLNLSLGTFGLFGGVEERSQLSITRPYMGGNRLIERLLEIDECKNAYREHLRKLCQTCFAPDRLVPRIQEMEKMVAKADETIRKANKNADSLPFGAASFARNAPAPTVFVTKRVESVMDQLAGKSEGIVSARMGGGRGGPVGDTAPSRVIAKALLAGMDADGNQKVSDREVANAIDAFYDVRDGNKDGAMARAELVEALEMILPKVDPSTMRPAGNQAQRGFRIFPQRWRPIVPGSVLASALIREGDADGNESLALEESLSAAKMVFKAADRDADGQLEERDLVDIMERLVPQPAAPATRSAAVQVAIPATRPTDR